MIFKNKIFIYLLIIFFAIFAGSGLFLLMNNKSVPKEEVQKTTNNLASIKQENLIIPTAVPSQGSLSLVTNVADARFALASGVVSVELVADSSGKNIGGYDVVLNYDPKKIEFVSAVSNLSDFKIYSNNNGNFLTLTAVQSLSNQAVVFKEARLATLNFRPLKTGKISLSLRSSTDKYLTDLVTDKTEVLYPALRDLMVDVY